MVNWTETIRRCLDVAARKGAAPTDEKVRRDYVEYLEAKHR